MNAANKGSPGSAGRFAPSPTGPLHAGSLVAALASWLDARAQGGRWLVRIEDVDGPRCVAGADETILAQLAACGLLPDEAPIWQSTRGARYQAALDRLLARGWAYPCSCSRSDIEAALNARGVARVRHAELVYPGTCRTGLHGKPARAVRALAAASAAPPQAPLTITWTDRRLGPQQQDVSEEVGDFVLQRADGLWAYQLAVVVDDAEQRITHVVRGEDLADNTARQIHLQRLLGLPTPHYLRKAVQAERRLAAGPERPGAGLARSRCHAGTRRCASPQRARSAGHRTRVMARPMAGMMPVPTFPSHPEEAP
jgi:glutamyl-Q tRNA(Asp) synthetase